MEPCLTATTGSGRSANSRSPRSTLVVRAGLNEDDLSGQREDAVSALTRPSGIVTVCAPVRAAVRRA